MCVHKSRYLRRKLGVKGSNLHYLGQNQASCQLDELPVR